LPSLAIVGASGRAAAASALRAGFQPIVADLFADADLRAIATTTRVSPYPDGLVDWLRAIEPPAWMYTGALENYPELIEQMAWIAPLWGNPGDVLIRVRSPWELAKALADAGLLFPETRASADGLPHDGSWLTKTYAGASGSGVRVFQESAGAGDVFQRRIAGTPCAAVFVALDATSILECVTRQIIGESWLGAHGFQYAGSIGPLPISESAMKSIERIGLVLTQHFELSGLFGIDFILNGDDVWTLEVNPRYTASVEICERATGSNTLTTHVIDWPEAPINSLKACTSVPALIHGKAIMFAKQDIVISEAFAEAALSEALHKPWPTLADVSPAHTRIEAGRPILTVFAEGATVDDVEYQLRSRVVELERQIYGSEAPS
jgi:predicted ATP-grasp superfamily ATP-dependent carboligase